MESRERVSRRDKCMSKTSHEQDLEYQHQASSSSDVLEDIIRKSITNYFSKCDHEVCQRTIFVRNVPHWMTENQLRNHFAKFGDTSRVNLVQLVQTDLERSAQIEYLDVSAAMKALLSPNDEHFYSDRRKTPETPKVIPIEWWGLLLKPNVLCCEIFERNRKKKNKQNGEDETDSHSYFNNLPDEIINYIFSYLDFAERIRIERVCKRWQDVNTNNTWVDMDTLNLQDKNKLITSSKRFHITNNAFASILKRCGLTLREINFDLDYNCSLTSEYSTEIAKYCPNLESADLSKTPIEITAMKLLIEKCENLHTLKLRACDGLDEEILCWVLQKGKKIKYLDLSYNYYITGESFHLVNDRLETLILNGCAELSPAHFLHLRNSRIKHLGINECESLTDNDLFTVITSLNSTLTALQLGTCFDYSFGGFYVFSRIFERCQNLQRLEIEVNYHVDFELIDLICKHCIQLQHISLSGAYLSGEDPTALCQLPHLRSVFLNDLVDISNDFIITLSLPGKLEHVELRRCRWVQDYGCVVLIKNSPNLKLLDVSGCTEVTNLTIGGVCVLERSANNKLKIIAGGSGISEFIDNDLVHVSSQNLSFPISTRYTSL